VAIDPLNLHMVDPASPETNTLPVDPISSVGDASPADSTLAEGTKRQIAAALMAIRRGAAAVISAEVLAAVATKPSTSPVGEAVDTLAVAAILAVEATRAAEAIQVADTAGTDFGQRSQAETSEIAHTSL
jgi:hypothetical protein